MQHATPDKNPPTSEHPAAPSAYLRRAEAARFLNISPRTLTEWQRRRIVPYCKVSHRVCLFRQADLDRALLRFRVAAVGEREPGRSGQRGRDRTVACGNGSHE